MKIFIFFSLILLSNSIFAQCDNPVSMDPPQIIHASCVGNGQITVTNVLPAIVGSDFQYSLYSPALATVVYTWQNSNVFTNIQAGSYEVRVRRKCTIAPYSSVSFITRPAIVNNTEIPTLISAVTVLRNAQCNNGVISVGALGSGPLEYALVPSLTESEPVAAYVRSRQLSNRFEGLPAGNYFLRVYNACNNAATLPFTIQTELANTRVEQLNGYFIPIGCDSVSFGFRVADYFKNTTNFPSDVNAKAWVKWPNGVVDSLIIPDQPDNDLLSPIASTIIKQTHITNFDPAYNPLVVWPSNLSNSSYQIEYGYKDVCGVNHSGVFTYVKTTTLSLKAFALNIDPASNCNYLAYRFSITHNDGIGTSTSQGFTSYQNFKYSLDGGSTWLNAASSAVLPNQIGNAYSKTLIFPRGVSQTILLDYCGTILTTTFTPSNTAVLSSTLSSHLGACLNRGLIRIKLNSINGSVLGVRVLSTPPGQPMIPYFETPVTPGVYLEPIELSNLIPGTYSIQLLDTIGVSCQLKNTLTITILPFTFDFSFNYSGTCNKNLEIVTTTSFGGPNRLRVKIYNNLGVQVLGNANGFEGNTDTYLNIPSSILASLPDGTYTIRVGRRIGTSLDTCSYIEKTWIKNSTNNLNLQSSIFISGCSDGLAAIGASAGGGLAPYQYSLFDQASTEVNPTSPGANTFNGLNPSQAYTLSVQDACGSVVNRIMSPNSQIEISAPGYSTMPCPGDDIALTVPQFTGVNYVWMKDGVIIPAETDNVLNLAGIQQSDSGDYQAIITIGGCEVSGSILINPNNCGGPLSVQLTAFLANCAVDGATKIGWVTASELNAMDFVIQKSADLINWEIVDVVQAHGSTNLENSYSTIDRKPFDDVTYYQLVQRDFNGTEKRYSPISNQCDAENVVGYKVYPNPSQGEFNVEVISDNQSELNLNILDMNGRLIFSKIYHVEKGTNTLYISEKLMKGIYIIQINNGNNNLNQTKLVIK